VAFQVLSAIEALPAVLELARIKSRAFAYCPDLRDGRGLLVEAVVGFSASAGADCASLLASISVVGGSGGVRTVLVGEAVF
jgi:hypothetical protein